MPLRLCRYENCLLALLATGLGFVILDRIALGLLAPLILPDLHLDDADLGWIAAALSLTLAGSGYAFGRLSDCLGQRSKILGLALLAFSLCSAVTGLARGLGSMVAARLLMGLTEGPILPLSYSIMALESSAHRRALNLGILANFATCLIGGILGPIALTHIATAYGWRAAFMFAGVPGLLLALAILRWVREPVQAAQAQAQEAPVQITAGAGRNVVLCMVLLSGLYSWLLVTLTFLPRYLVVVSGVAPAQIGWVSAAYSVSGVTLAIGVGALADRIGRRTACILFSFAGLAVPVGVLLFPHNLPVMVTLIVVGWSFIGVSPLLAGTVPSESVAPQHVARTLASIIGMAEVVGGVVMTAIAGLAARHFGLAAPFWIVAAMTALSAVGSFWLVETETAKPARAAQA